ncbi:MAG TPA: cobaltochelatase subunit CobN [Hyphomicrobiales bacterium]|nr:cobaltochelatase subunit CobN [Hyphomicrobiales bacterium]
MHILAAQSGVIADGSEAVDLAQSAGDIVVLSAADSELAALARAQDLLGADAPSLRLANIMALGHNLSVDLYMRSPVSGAKLVVVRLLGGAAYWAYGLEQLEYTCRDNGIGLAVLPGGGEADPALQARSTLAGEDVEILRCYLAEPGPENVRNFLKFCGHLVGRGEAPPEARALLKAGIYWPGLSSPSLGDIRTYWREGRPLAALTFYRALIEGGNTAPVDALVAALAGQGLNALPLYVTSLKDDVVAATLARLFDEAAPSVILNATGFAVGSTNPADNPLCIPDAPVLQAVFSGSSRAAWAKGTQGLSARDLAMNVVLPELDGRILSRAVSFKADAVRHEATQSSIVTYAPEPDRVAFVAGLAASWARLRLAAPERRRIAIVLANYPNRDGRIGNGVGYDTPASTVNILHALAGAGYALGALPADAKALMARISAGPTNAPGGARAGGETLPLADYRRHFEGLPQRVRDEIAARWGAPENDPFVTDDAFRLAVIRFGNVVVGVQPARGYNIDPKETYHDPALVPPHGYLAFYFWLRHEFGAQAVVHNGKHGNLEWLPGKAVALSQDCFPEAVLGPLPNLYPFIVNDPGEGTQAKRRNSAVIVDHLTPPLTRAESYGPLKDLEALIDEYYLASGLDPRRRDLLRKEILDLTRSSGLDMDAGISGLADEDAALQRLDTYICELKESQIRNGLHVLGEAPQDRLETDLLVALTRVPRGVDENGDASLIRALAADLGCDGFDPLDCDLGAPWPGPRPEILVALADGPWRTAGDTVERLEALASALVDGSAAADPGWAASAAVLAEIEEKIRPALRQCGPDEIATVLKGLDGRFVAPGPSGAPTRGRLDVLPTGRNFFSVDNRAVPTPAAWTLGRKSAERLVERHFQDHGSYPKSLGLSVWGTSNMRTGGDDIAQGLALIGAAPKWDRASWRVTGFEILPLAKLARPRVDVTLRVSGFFRDAFPAQIDLFDSAVRAIAALEEDEADNPIAARIASEAAELERGGLSAEDARRRAGFRVFGSRPGAYGAGLQALIDEKLWDSRDDLAASYVNWGAYAYGSGAAGARDEDGFRRRLGQIEAVVHNQDNREHDLLDSDDYYQFEGGMSAAVEHLSGQRPAVYHNDHSRPERPVVRTLEEEVGRVMRSRVVNPKWIAGVMRHGYKGAFEIAATLDYMFAFAATTGAVRSDHFDLAYEAFIAGEEVRDFLEANNPAALREISQRFLEALSRNLWTPKSNAAYHELSALAAGAREEMEP